MAMGTATKRAAEKKKDKANNPSPVRSIAEGNAIARAGGVKAQFKQSEVTNAEGNKVYSTKPVSAGGSQFDVLANANKTRAGTTDRQIVQAQIDREKLKKQMEAEQTVANVSPEELAKLRQFTTEEQIYANPQDNEMPKGNPDIEDILRTAKEKALIAGAGGLVGGSGLGTGIGAGVGAMAGGIGAIPGAVIGSVIGAGVGAVGAGAVGAVVGTIQEYNQQSANDVSSVQNNFDNAKTLLETSIMSTNKAGGNPSQLISDFKHAEQAMKRAQKQMQYISIHDKRGDEKATRAKVEMELYINKIMPQMVVRMENSLKKPDPNYMQYPAQTTQ